MNYVWYRDVAESPELTELLLDKRGTSGLVSVHRGQLQDRYIEELKHTAAQQAIWVLHQTVGRLRSVLLEFYPQALQAFPNLKHVAPSVRTNSRDRGNFRRCGIGGVFDCLVLDPPWCPSGTATRRESRSVGPFAKRPSLSHRAARRRMALRSLRGRTALK
jgi:hypothetical protein